ncbi:hypothetical protein ACL1C4_14450, partial [Corynebacterium striatum]
QADVPCVKAQSLLVLQMAQHPPRTQVKDVFGCSYWCKNQGHLVKSADVVYEFFRIVGDRLAGIGSGTGLGVVGH